MTAPTAADYALVDKHPVYLYGHDDTPTPMPWNVPERDACARAVAECRAEMQAKLDAVVQAARDENSECARIAGERDAERKLADALADLLTEQRGMAVGLPPSASDAHIAARLARITDWEYSRNLALAAYAATRKEG